MQLTQWKPLEDEFSDFPLAFRKFGGDLSVDLYEEDSNLVAKMTLPGITPEDIDITIDDDLLTVSGMREEEQETDEKDYYSKEIRRGSFSRAVRLPKAVDAEATSADYKDGVLVITMPTVESEERSGIKVPVNQLKP